jgi:hypothetical protein
MPSPEQLKGEIAGDPVKEVDNFVTKNPDKAETISKLYVPGATDQDVLDYINLTWNK